MDLESLAELSRQLDSVITFYGDVPWSLLMSFRDNFWDDNASRFGVLGPIGLPT